MSDEQQNSEKPSEPQELWIERPVVRGVINGVMFGVALAVINIYGFFGPAVPLTQEAAVEYAFAAILFGFVVYILQLWRQQRKRKAQALAKAEADKQDDNSSQ